MIDRKKDIVRMCKVFISDRLLFRWENSLFSKSDLIVSPCVNVQNERERERERGKGRGRERKGVGERVKERECV